MDAPVSNSGRLKQRIIEILNQFTFEVDVKVINNVDAILEKIAITPKFRNYDRRLDELNYLIQNALKNNQLNLQLFNIQHQINKNEY